MEVAEAALPPPYTQSRLSREAAVPYSRKPKSWDLTKSMLLGGRRLPPVREQKWPLSDSFVEVSCSCALNQCPAKLALDC